MYLPESWTEDPVRRKKAHIPDEVPFRTKHELALAMIRRAVADGVPKGGSSPTRRTVTRASSATRCGSLAWTTRSRFTLRPRSGGSASRGGLTVSR
ncbi:MAG: transposase [Armatimonadota bacterium]|nr:transposase [Armatimonadota bacterium]